MIGLLQVAHDHLGGYLDEALTFYGGAELVRRTAGHAAAVIHDGVRAIRALVDRNALPDPERLDIFLNRSPHLGAELLSEGFELSEEEVDGLMALLGYERSDGADEYTLTTTEIARLANHIYGLCEWSDAWDDAELEQAASDLRSQFYELLERLHEGKSLPAGVEAGWRARS